MTTKTDFTVMSNADLVRTFNDMIHTAIDLGAGVDRYKTVSRFSSSEAGIKRCEALESTILALEQSAKAVKAERGVNVGHPVEPRDAGDPVYAMLPGADPAAAPVDNAVNSADAQTGDDDMAAKRKAGRKPARATKARPASAGPTLASFTEEWNSLVPQAVKAGVKGVKKHTSNFETRAKAEARIKWIKDAIKDAIKKA